MLPSWWPVPAPDLYEERNCVESEDFHAIHGVPGQDVQGSCAALHYLFHLDSILQRGKCSVSRDSTSPPLEHSGQIGGGVLITLIPAAVLMRGVSSSRDFPAVGMGHVTGMTLGE